MCTKMQNVAVMAGRKRVFALKTSAIHVFGEI